MVVHLRYRWRLTSEEAPPGESLRWATPPPTLCAPLCAQCNEAATSPSVLRAPDESEPYSWDSCSSRTIERGKQMRDEHADALTKAVLSGDGLEMCVELIEGGTATRARVHVGAIEKMMQPIEGGVPLEAEKEEL